MMKNIKKIEFCVSLHIGFEDIDVDESVYNGLRKIEDNAFAVYEGDLLSYDDDVQSAIEWIFNRNLEIDSFSQGVEIEELEQ